MIIKHLPTQPNPSLNLDLAYSVSRSLSSSRFLGFAQRLGAGGAGWLPSLGLAFDFQPKDSE